jgi:hypothetical protein
MSDLLVAAYATGVQVPARLELSGGMVLVEGRPPTFAVDWLDAAGNVFLHFNPRAEEGTVVLNSFLDGGWGEEMKVDGFPFPSGSGAPFRLRFDVWRRSFRISVDGRRLCEFRHRRSPGAIREVRAKTFLWRLDATRRLASPPTAIASPRSGSDDSWSAAEANPASPDRLEGFRFFAVISTWMEEDVVASTVANAFRQGCERVYLVDNGSPDATVERAVAAGAILGRNLITERYDDVVRMGAMQEVVEEVSAAEVGDHVWWLFADADEFHHGPGGHTLVEYLASLDRRFRVVGARFFNHFPSGNTADVDGRHPLDYQRLCYEIPAPVCELGHSNHPLQRWDREGALITVGGGAHAASCAETLLEPSTAVFFHHFPYRQEAFTRRRLERVFGLHGGERRASAAASRHMGARLESLDAVYRQRLHEAVLFPPCVRGFAPELRPFEDWVGHDDGQVARWY